MTDELLPDPSTPFGERVARRLRDDPVVWLTTVGAGGAPRPNPVWFLWDGETFLVYNAAHARRLRHIVARPLVALNFDRDDAGSVIVANGLAALSPGEPPAHRAPAFMAKYGPRMAMGPERWAEAFPVALRVRPMRVRGHLGG